MGGNKVLQHVQTFTEVRRDGGLNDGAVRLSHQTTHTRQLTNLSGGTASARVSHHVDGVERFLFDFFAMAVDGLLFAELVHHHLGHSVASLTPDVNHLVVTLARSHQTGHVLLFDVFDFFFRRADDGAFFWRHQHVVDRDGDTSASRQTETVLQQFVGEHDGLFQTALAE